MDTRRAYCVRRSEDGVHVVLMGETAEIDFLAVLRDMLSAVII